MKLNIVLIAPEIPQNTGNIGRLCVNMGMRLHLIEPLGFSIEDKMLRRAGLDYWKDLDPQIYPDWETFMEKECPENFIFMSTKTEQCFYDYRFKGDEYLVFGNEGHGLPVDFYERYKEQLYTLPMPGHGNRSLNIANAVAVGAYEAYRQLEIDR
ncbi:MAG: tRNA (cytidine(34)-2'-O)-methyltransferase [Lentisphaeria bacterium]|nr:tRNA (cytidine(34)-2'-O)-methyltransferase [Lentisphaeria bacterium]NQZ71373.1 tRNA (cytidine(34)-2'-O)-methyltransferase [Lentisphaeria bacterium]